MSGLDKKCPEWAQQAIEQLRQIEVYLGHIPKASDWGADFIDKVNSRAFSPEDQVFDEDKAQLVFQKICVSLTQESAEWTPERIAEVINLRIGYSEGPKYCDASEVKDALEAV
ncbi:MAG: hypothetical protein AB8C84_05190 [Oligoflexales bacterium]